MLNTVTLKANCSSKCTSKKPSMSLLRENKFATIPHINLVYLAFFILDKLLLDMLLNQVTD